MNRLIHKIKLVFSTFHAKLLLAFFICIVIPLGIMCNVLFNVTYQIASDRILNTTLLADDQLNVQINNRIKQTENVADSIQYNLYLLTNETGSLSEYISTFNEVRNNIYLYKTTFDFHHIYVFLPEEQMGSSEGLYFFPLSRLSDFQLSNYQLENPGTNVIWFYQKNSEVPFVLSTEGARFNTLACCRVSKNQFTDALDYAYIIILNPDELSDLLVETFSENNIVSYLISPNGRIMAHTDKTKCGSMLTKGQTANLINASVSKNHLYKTSNTYYHTVQLTNGWYHITEIPQNFLGENTMLLLQTIVTSFAVIIPLTLCMIIFFSRNLTKRIKQLSGAMENFRLNNVENETIIDLTPISKDPALYDEIDKLSYSFTNMQTTLHKNMKSILDLSLSEEKLKYQLLQSQINPHFLYNILGTIKTCQSLGKLDVAEQMLINLSQFYRLLLRKSNDLISISDELQIARLYLEMEHLCRGDNLTWEINAEAGIENYLICKFTLQPVLENSILHGYSNNISQIHISVDVMYEDDDVIIIIKDNGCGIPPEQLVDLQQTLRNKTVNYEKHFGIGNINHRISSPSFGNGYVSINSQIGKGTEVIISFAQLEESE